MGSDHLVAVDVSDNPFGNPGLQKLGASLQSNTNLRSLRLNGIGCDDEGVQLLCDALIENTTLVDLALARNDMSSVACSYLAPILLRDILISLDLSDNPLISTSGIACLASPIALLRSLMSWSINGSQCKIKGAQALADVIRSNRHITHLGLKLRFETDNCAPILYDALTLNKVMTSCVRQSNCSRRPSKVSPWVTSAARDSVVSCRCCKATAAFDISTSTACR
jgi:Ran GTPase-activating protein (RanGAP) involved in mRNA processing and transport